MVLSIIFIIVTAFICFILPALIAVIMIIKRKGKWYMFLLGVVSFTVSQLLIRIPLLDELLNTVWFNIFILTQPFLYAMLLALSAGVFEEAGRYAALRFLNKGLLTWENGLLFGLGHGGIEALWIVGIPYLKQIVSIISAGGIAALAGSPPLDFLTAGVERMLTLALHIGFTMLVLYAVKRRNVWFFILAVMAHALVDALVPLIGLAKLKMDPRGYMWLIEGAVAVFAAIAVIVTLKMKSALKDSNGGYV